MKGEKYLELIIHKKGKSEGKSVMVYIYILHRSL